jgi:hypothetical protein
MRNKENNKTLSNHEFFNSLYEIREFSTFFRSLMLELKFQAYRFESCLQGPEEMHSDFRFSIIDSPELITKAEPDVFPAINEENGAQYKIFPNLGGDALLISPTSLGGSKSYASLVDFVKFAPEEQFFSLMQVLGSTALEKMKHANFYFSTAGAGVAWLHFRFDESPKYFRNRNLLG